MGGSRQALRRLAHRGARAALGRMPPAAREVALALAAAAGTGPLVLPGPPPGAVLVVAPHPDDETIGCGGALARHVDAGDPVTVLVATSGEASGGGGVGLGATRESECRAACAALGIPPPMFLRLPDGALSDHEDRLSAAIRAVDPAPAVVYAPALLDPHPDHRAANRALAAAELPAPVYGYEVWAAASVDCVLDIGTAWERKARALDCYPSALSVVDYRVSARGLAAYRGVAAGLGPQGLAEGFVCLTPAEHTAHSRGIG